MFDNYGDPIYLQSTNPKITGCRRRFHQLIWAFIILVCLAGIIATYW